LVFSSHLYSLYAHTESQRAGDLLIPEGAERVTGYGSPNVRRRRLAAELRRLRERAGFIGEEVARRLEWSTSKISRLERGQSGVKRTDLRRLLELYRVEPRRREELLALAEESQPSSRLRAISAGLPEEHAQFLSFEAEAASVWNWEPQIVPGLLQTEDYARAVMLGWHSMFTEPPSELERRVEARRLRQQVLQRVPPLQLSVVMDESVLYRKLGEASVMRAQLQHIVATSRLPNIRVRILPLKSDNPVTTGAFTYLKFPQLHDVPLNDIVTSEYMTGTDQFEDQDETFKYSVAFRALEQSSLDLDQSREKLARVATEEWG
jgi:transcriptional regulator with XRE-family HTH domain